jgi:hypothetical protein
MRTRELLLITCILVAAIGIASCSIPNLEGQQCTVTRDVVREFYSWYLGTDAAARQKQRDVYDRYIASNFHSAATAGLDPFFLSDTTPTTFKVGKCEVKDDSHVSMQVQIYWRQDQNVDQKEVYADVEKIGDKWQIDKVDGR